MGFESFTEMGLSDAQIDVNAKYLHDKGLIEAHWGLDSTRPGFAIITAYGMDVVEKPETLGRQFPFIQNNIQIIKGGVINSVVAQSSGNQSINISESFNQIYEKIDSAEDIDSSSKEELKDEVREIEEHVKKGKLDPDWLKEKANKIKGKAVWLGPILQVVITEAIKKYLGL